MTVFALGINHRTASLAIRERVAFDPEQMVLALRALSEATGLGEVAILSTCNRTEIYGANGDASSIQAWLCDYHGVNGAELQSSLYLHNDENAVRHIMKVASGLDSMVLGEPQILGQLKAAYAVAREAGTLNYYLEQLFQQAFAMAKRVRTETAIGQSPVSVAYSAVSLSQQIFSELADVSALLIGAGETIELAARHLREKGVRRLTVANRTLTRAQILAEQFGADAILLSDIPNHLHKADMVISSTASQLPILGKGAVESALKKRKHKPMFMVDIAVPRDIESEVGSLDDVYLYTVDDLQEVIQKNIKSREAAAAHAAEIIEEGVQRWGRQLRAKSAAGTIRSLRSRLETIRDREVQRAVQLLESGQQPEEVVRQLARSLTNKLLHKPTTRLRQESEDGRTDHLELIHDLFDIKPVDAANKKGREDSR